MAIDHNGDQIAALMRRYYPLLLTEAAAAASRQLGMDIAFDLAMDEVQQVLHTLGTQVRTVARTTQAEVNTLVAQAAREGWSVDTLAAAIREHGITASRTRSESIAHTETAMAYSQGALLAYKTSGVVQGTEWILTDNACPICTEFAGKTVPLGGEFAAGITSPPAHTRCRCALVPVLTEDA